MTPEEVIARALLHYVDPPGRTLWGAERSEDKARAVLSALDAAGLVVMPGEDIHIYESALKQIIENSTSPLTVACARYANNTVERGRRAATSPGVPLAADPARRD